MSVLVKGMEMPKNCFRCDIRRSCDLAWYLDPDNRPDNCPLVEVPVPHGRLIDADELADFTNNILHKAMIFGGQHVYSQSAIDNAPTVIEAEEK